MVIYIISSLYIIRLIPVSSDLSSSIVAVWSSVQLNVASSFENPAIHMVMQQSCSFLRVKYFHRQHHHR